MAKPVSRRPWYLAVALVVLALSGAFGAATGCSSLSYLRGASSLVPAPSAELPPMLRLALVREQARLESFANHHRVAFPLSAGRLLLGGLLLVASIGALAGRAWARTLVLQAMAAWAGFAAIEFALLGAVRGEVSRAVGHEAAAIDRGFAGNSVDEQAVAEYTQLAQAFEWGRLALFELGVLGGAALALSRPRARAFFAARAREAGTAEE